MRISVQEDAFDLGREAAAFAAGGKGDTGAIVTFTGVVRDSADAPLVAMEIEHYPGMTESALREMAQTAVVRFDLADVLVIHRYGRLAPGEVIMMVATAARHRVTAFEAAEFLMDYLKSRAPFWKREISANGAAWVAAKDDDEEALGRWQDRPRTG
jgi:molybdopterin synthase catalytic subunit